MTWAIKWRSGRRLDDAGGHLMGRFGHGAGGEVPVYMRGYTTMAFETRREAREFIQERYSYIHDSPDLRRKPHYWKMPIPVKVNVTVKEMHRPKCLT